MHPVFSFTSAQLTGWVVAFIWPFVRMLALLSTAPMFSEKTIPREVRLILAIVLSIAICPLLGPMPNVAPMSGAGLWILIQQLIIGSAIGVSMQLVFAAVQAAGDYIGLQMGLSFASFFDINTSATTVVISSLLNMLAILLFLATDSHLAMISILVDSFRLLPISSAPLLQAGWQLLAYGGGVIFTMGLLLSLPLVTALLAINLSMGILNRASPQLSIFAIGFPITLFSGLVLLQLMMPRMAPFMLQQFTHGLEGVARVLSAFAAAPKS